MKLFFCFNGTYEGDGKGGEGSIAGKGGIGPDEHPKFAFRTEAAAIRFRSKVDPFNDHDKNNYPNFYYNIGSATVKGNPSQVFEVIAHIDDCTMHFDIYASKAEATARAAKEKSNMLKKIRELFDGEGGEGDEEDCDVLMEVLPIEVLDEYID